MISKTQPNDYRHTRSLEAEVLSLGNIWHNANTHSGFSTVDCSNSSG